MKGGKNYFLKLLFFPDTLGWGGLSVDSTVNSSSVYNLLTKQVCKSNILWNKTEDFAPKNQILDVVGCLALQGFF